MTRSLVFRATCCGWSCHWTTSRAPLPMAWALGCHCTPPVQVCTFQGILAHLLSCEKCAFPAREKCTFPAQVGTGCPCTFLELCTFPAKACTGCSHKFLELCTPLAQVGTGCPGTIHELCISPAKACTRCPPHTFLELCASPHRLVLDVLIHSAGLP